MIRRCAMTLVTFPLSLLLGWQLDGVPVCTKDSLQLLPVIVSDGDAATKGAILAWCDDWDAVANVIRCEVYAKRILGANGSAAQNWGADGNVMSLQGVPLPYYGHRLGHVVVAGEPGSIIAAWVDDNDQEEHRSGIYCQKMMKC